MWRVEQRVFKLIKNERYGEDETLWHEVNMARKNRVGTQEGVGIKSVEQRK